MIPRLVLGTKNSGKRAEMTELVERLRLAAEIVGGLDWEDVDETGSTLLENALLKGRAVGEATGLPVLADDTGLEVAALNGAPGLHSARFAGENATFDDNVAKLLNGLKGAGDRSARFVTVVALVMPDGEYVTAEGVLAGEISRSGRGEGGFGYDPVFEVDGVTLAEMGPEAKNRLSHRARAIENLASLIG